MHYTKNYFSFNIQFIAYLFNDSEICSKKKGMYKLRYVHLLFARVQDQLF